MRLLLDTHTFLRFVWQDAHLSATARTLIVDPNNELLFSPASY
jgi:PIN domain nuclease of toxin-antitoxin system